MHQVAKWELNQPMVRKPGVMKSKECTRALHGLDRAPGRGQTAERVERLPASHPALLHDAIGTGGVLLGSFVAPGEIVVTCFCFVVVVFFCTLPQPS